MVERWKPVPCYEDLYQVSDQGRIRRIAGGFGARVGRILRPCADRHGYLFVTLCRSGHRKTERIHTLVAEAFLGPCPAGLEVNHKYGIKDDNRGTELEYLTPSENVKHTYRVLGRKPVRGEAQGRAKLTDDSVREIRRLYAKGGITQHALAERHSVSGVTIQRIIRRERWVHVA